MGSATYEWMLRHVVQLGSAAPEPWPYQQPTWVFSSRSLERPPDADIRFARGDVRPVHVEMRAAANGKNIWLSAAATWWASSTMPSCSTS